MGISACFTQPTTHTHLQLPRWSKDRHYASHKLHQEETVKSKDIIDSVYFLKNLSKEHKCKIFPVHRYASFVKSVARL